MSAGPDLGLAFSCGGDFFGAVSDSGVPQRCEVVRNGVDGVCGVNFPVAGEGRLGVGNVEEAV